MTDFPHLPLVQTISGVYKPPGGGGNNDENPQTRNNKQNRQQHGQTLLQTTASILADRKEAMRERAQLGLPEMPGANHIPIFLQIDTDSMKLESLKGMGIEVISEEDDGYIIGASLDGFVSLHTKIEKFINQDGLYKNQAAQLWQIIAGSGWRVDQIVSGDLRERWQTVTDEELVTVDISIACHIERPEQPKIKAGEANNSFQRRLSNWQDRISDLNLQHLDLIDIRVEEIQRFFDAYSTAVPLDLVQFDDSFSFRVEVSGQALKDFVQNYPYVFEVAEYEVIQQAIVIDGIPVEPDLEIITPNESAPNVCVIDSGLQENHRLLEPAIKSEFSLNYDPIDDTTADLVRNGGHGTRVAGAVLFGPNIPLNGQYQPHCFILNARILDQNNLMSSRLFPPTLMEEIVSDFYEATIFNLSVTGSRPCRTVHMSSWAATIDKISHEHGNLFIVSAGNVADSGSPNNPGIIEHILAGRQYPDYLLESTCRIANPAQSHFAITVGSICLSEFDDDDRSSFGKRNMLSSFSRTGLGMWGAIKPEVVEYGGDWIKEKRGTNLTIEGAVNPLLVRSGGLGVDRNAIGTSFATPKVTHIASILQASFPNAGPLFYKTLIIQSARLPESCFLNPDTGAIRKFGYGIPNLKRASENSESRVTFLDTNNINAGSARIYTISFPHELRRQGESFDILIEATLTFSAKPRRTRRKTQSYLSSWLSWESSRLGESHDAFVSRVVKNMDNQSSQTENDANSIKWTISTNPIWGKVKNIRRQDSTCQKDWVVLKSNTLSASLSFAVVGHKGWERDLSELIPFTFAVSIESLGQELQIYQELEVANRVETEVQQEILADLK